MRVSLADVAPVLAEENWLTAEWLGKWARLHRTALVETVVAVVAVVLVSVIVAPLATRKIADETRRNRTRRTITFVAQLLALVAIVIVWAGELNWQLIVNLSHSEPVVKWAGGHLGPLIVTCVAVALALFISTVVARHATRGIGDEVRRHKARRTVAYITQIVALAVVAVTWAGQLNWQLWAGLVSVGVALALQTAILCFAGWLNITLRRPFDIGDRIQAGKYIGDVIDIGPIHTYILEVGNWVNADQSTGRVAYIPNSFIFTQPYYNYTQGFPYIWNELAILVTFESDWRRAKMILEDLANRQARDMSDKVRLLIQRMKRDYPIRYMHLHPIVYTNIRDSGVLLTIRYLTEVRERRQTECDLCEDILGAFAKEPDITFAYPTYRMFRGTGLGPLMPPGSSDAAASQTDEQESPDEQ